MRRRRKILVRLTLAVVAPAVCLLGLEGVGRIWLASHGQKFWNRFWVLDPGIGARLRPGYEGLDDQGIRVTINSRGLRSPEVATAKTPGRLRILALGDSVTYGYGVLEREAYPRVLERELRDRGVDAEVVNAGITGYSTYQGWYSLEHDLLDLEPDVVLFAFMNNDRWDSRGKVHDAAGMRKEYEARERRAWLLYNTALGRMALRFLAGGLDGVLATPNRVSREAGEIELWQSAPVELPPPRAPEPVDPDDARIGRLDDFRALLPTVGLEQRRRLCEHVQQLADEHGFRLVFLNLYDNGYMCEPLRRAVELAAAGRPAESLDQVLAYFAIDRVPRSSAAHLLGLDPFANRLLVDLYEALDTPADQRHYYFPRRPQTRAVLLLDTQVNAVATRVTAEGGSEVLDSRDLELTDYLDYVHLSPRGHRAVAARIADLLAPR